MTKTIYVVGYPKSGNTWLTRMVARLLNSKVRDEVMRGTFEVATSINAELENPDQNYDVAKIHFLPDAFLQEVDKDPKYIIYVFRDFRSVVISAFHYFNKYPTLKKFHKFERQSRWLSLTWFAFLKHVHGRFLWKQYLKRFYSKPIHETFGTWDEHLREWKKYLNDHQEVYSVFVSYEKIRKEPIKELNRILEQLGLESTIAIGDCVEMESIGRLKKANNHLTEGKARVQYKNLLRSGLLDEWELYFDSRDLKQYHQKGLNKIYKDLLEH